MRVIVLVRGRNPDPEKARLDGQVRIGHDAGAGEVIVLEAFGATASDEEGLVTGLLLPDAPVVVWWTGDHPDDLAGSALGRISQRRIVDSSATSDPARSLATLGRFYVPGDSDFAWSRVTLWRAQLAAALDQPPYEQVTSAQVSGTAGSASTWLLARWLGSRLGIDVTVQKVEEVHGSSGLHGVTLTRASGDITLERLSAGTAVLVQPGQPDHEIALPRRELPSCLAEELRRLDPDELLGELLAMGSGT
jgi:glucose-6-phosphate dehydrogenase assembly protein OpcA